MKLRNKKTGWLTEDIMMDFSDGEGIVIDGIRYDRISDINNDWEDYEEPKEYWHIAEMCAGLQKQQDTDNSMDRFNKQIGNYFETQEEAEKAVEKLKAWKRLKDDGFEFEGVIETWFGGGRVGPLSIHFNKHDDDVWVLKHRQDLELLFGGEE